MSLQQELKQFKSKRFYGKVNVLVNEVCTIEKEESSASTKELSELVRSIQKDDLDLLKSLLNASSGKNISDHLVHTTLPRKWHHVAKNVMSTPLRTSLSWRNIKALELLLESKCKVTSDDITAGLQLVLRHVDGEVELELISRLVRTGTISLEGPVPLTFTFDKLLSSGVPADDTKAREIVNILTGHNASNNLKGMTLLAVAKHSAKFQARLGQMDDDTQWRDFSRNSMKTVLQTTFSPAEFIKDAGVWLSLGSVSFQHIIHALPLIVQTMAGKCPLEALGWLLRLVSRAYPHCNQQGKDKIISLPCLMYESGIDLPKILSIACLSPRFLNDTGFSHWSAHFKRNRLRSLQQFSRVTIRQHIVKGNVYQGMERISCIPPPLKQFILLMDVQPLPWTELH